MASTLISGIGELVTNDPGWNRGPIGVLHDAAVVVEGEEIVWVGSGASAPVADLFLDAAGRAVIPGFVDSHAHLIFAGERSREFEARMEGRSYGAGGILTTVAATRAAGDEELRSRARSLVGEMTRQGTTTLEVKSGYGLTVHDESRALRIAKEFTEDVTYLGAHVVPPEFARDPGGYIDLVTGAMLDAAAADSRWIDVFCDRGAFGEDEARAVLSAGLAKGLMPRIHANQLGPGPGARLAAEFGAAAADHCTHLDAGDVAALADSGVIATLLPGAEFSTRSVYPDALRLLAAGVTIALATDCNPGSSFTTSMPFCIALAVREMKMTVAQALWSATRGGALALRRTDRGQITAGARADVVLLDAPSHVHLAYRPGVPLIEAVMVGGATVAGAWPNSGATVAQME